jgi:hypothetical protein
MLAHNWQQLAGYTTGYRVSHGRKALIMRGGFPEGRFHESEFRIREQTLYE